MQGAVWSIHSIHYSCYLLPATITLCAAVLLPACIHDLKICSLCRLEWAQIEHDIMILRVKDSIKEMEKNWKNLKLSENNLSCQWLKRKSIKRKRKKNIFITSFLLSGSYQLIHLLQLHCIVMILTCFGFRHWYIYFLKMA